VESFSPSDNTAGVAVDTDLLIDFRGDVQKGIGNIVIKHSSDTYMPDANHNARGNFTFKPNEGQLG